MTQTKIEAKSTPARVSTLLRGISPRSLRIALGLLAAGLTITVFASLYIKAEVEAAAQREFSYICNEIQINIADRLAHNAQILRSGAALFDASETVTRAEWHTFIQSLQVEQQLPGTQGIGFALLIPPEQLTQHIEEIRGEGFPAYQVKPAGERDIYSSIIYLEPFSDLNLRAFGYDMFSEPVRRAAMVMARDKNIAALSGKVILVQETGEAIQSGALMYVPVYRQGLPIDTVEQRRAAIVGWVYSPYRMTDLMRGTLRGWDLKQRDTQIYLQVYDGNVISAENLLYDSQSDGDKTPAAAAQITRQTQVNFAGHRWTLLFTQFGELASTADYDSVWLILFGGIIISLLVFWLMISLLSTRANARQMAAQLTTDLRESEEKYSVVFNNEIYAISIFDLETLKLLDVNEAYVRLYGYSREELTSGMTVHDITAEQQASDSAVTQATHEGATFIPVRHHRKKDGTVFPVELVAGTYEWQGRKVMFVLAHDITERKQAEDNLRESEEKFRAIIEQSSEGIMLIDEQGCIVEWNSAHEQITGIPRAEALGQPTWYIQFRQIPTARRAQITVQYLKQTLLKMLETGQSPQFNRPIEVRVETPSGEFKTLQQNAFSIKTDKGYRLGIILHDVTKRKQMEEVLSESKERLLEVLENSLDASYKRNLQTNAYDYLSPVFTRISGYTPDEMKTLPIETILSFMHPDDKVETERVIAEAISGATGAACQTEYRLKHKDGQYRWLHDRFTVMRNADDQPAALIGSVSDITARKKMEDALRESEERYHTVVSNAPVVIFVTDKKGIFTLSEGQGLKMLGLQPGQVTGLSVFDVYRDYPAVTEAMNNALAGHSQRSEVDVQGIVFDTLFSPVLDPNGSVVKVIGVSTDITKRKQAEAALHESEEKYRLLFENAGDAIFIHDKNARMLAVNPTACEQIGYTHAELMSMTIDQVDTPEEAQHAPARIARLMEQGYLAFETTHRRKDGSPIATEVSARLIIWDGQPAMMSLCRNITARKHVENLIVQKNEELRKAKEKAEESENILNLFLQHSPILMYLKDENIRALRLSNNFEQLLGMPVQQMLGKTNDEIWSSVFAQKMAADDLMTMSNNEKVEIQEELNGKFYTTIKFPVQLEGKPRYLAGFSIDITERKQAEDALRLSEEKYRTVANFTYDWETWRGPDNTYLYVSPSCERITGHTVAEFLADSNLVIKIADPDDLPKIKEHFGASFNGSKREDLNLDFRIITPDGKTRWIGHSCTAVFGEDGQWWGRRESNRDITTRKLAEMELQYMKESLESANIELKAALIREQQLARTDALTGVNSRGYLRELAAREFELSARYQQPLSMLMVDIDDFKNVNDTFGHAIGDQAIQCVSQIISAEIRSPDIVGRYGAGDEFTILVPQTSAQEALPLAERIHASVNVIRMETDKGALTLTISIGIAQTLGGSTQLDTVENLFLRADQALYAVKQSGKNNTMIFNQE